MGDLAPFSSFLAINGTASVYPIETRIEFSVATSDEKAVGRDWAALRLVFEPYQGRWYLVAEVIDAWAT